MRPGLYRSLFVVIMIALLAGFGSFFALNPVKADAAGTTELISQSSGGEQGTIESLEPSVSGDGRYVAFYSSSGNLVAGDTNDRGDIFVRDRLTGTTERVSVSSSGAQSNGSSLGPKISADGRYVVFYSDATNLISNDATSSYDVYLHDRETGQTELVSVTTGGVQVYPGATKPAITPDGRYVAFLSPASNFGAGDTVTWRKVYVRDRLTGTTTKASVAYNGNQPNHHSEDPFISADGRYVTFHSTATNLVAGDTNNFTDVFIRDLQEQTTERASVSSNEEQANQWSGKSAVSADGRYVIFSTGATNLVTTPQSYLNIIVRDRLAGTTDLLTIPTTGGEANGTFSYPTVSPNGRFVAFFSAADNLVAGDTNGVVDTFLFDRDTGEIERVSVSSTSQQGNADSYYAGISMDGRFAAFSSLATNLAADITPNVEDIFLRDRCPGGVCDGLISLTGQVLDDGGVPVAGVLLMDQLGNAAMTGSDGIYTFTDLAPGMHVLEASKPGYTFGPPQVEVNLPHAGPPVDFIAYACLNASADFDLCRLQPGDIILTSHDATISGVAAMINIGGSYFTHAALYAGLLPDESGTWVPTVVEAQGPAGGANDVWTNTLLDSGAWTGDETTDWAVMRPDASDQAKAVAVAYALGKAEQVGVTYRACLNHPMCLTFPLIPQPLTSETEFYCSGLVWKAYDYAGIQVSRQIGQAQVLTGGWIKPEDLYFGSPELFSKPGKNRTFIRIYSPAHLILEDPLGRKTGFDPVSGTDVIGIPGTDYVRSGTQIETINILDQADLRDWKITAVGFEQGEYELEFGSLRANTYPFVYYGQTAPGEEDVYDVITGGQGVYLPLLVK